jgi:taurine transport system ATP-binding protein
MSPVPELDPDWLIGELEYEEGATGTGGRLEVNGLVHRFGKGKNQVTALEGISFFVPAGEFVVLLGPSGCGKSTLLRLIAGFEPPTEGTVLVNGEKPVPGVQAGQVFQSPRLFPWHTVGGNVEVALRYAGVNRAQRREQAEHLLEQVGLPGVYSRRIWEISGGQQQRVAIARAHARRAPLFLLDEPFAALDALTRERLQEDLRALSHRLGTTTVFVTHSVDEAVFLASRVLVMSPGPGRVVLDLPIGLPRVGIDADDLRAQPEYAALRAELAHAVRSTRPRR